MTSSIVDTLLSRLKLAEVADRLGITLSKQGDSNKAICPFHQDSKPSLVLYDNPTGGDRPHYNCFVCGAHGDIFDIVQKQLGKSFAESVEWLAREFGIPLPPRGTRRPQEQTSETIKEGVRREGLRRAYEIYRQPDDGGALLEGFAQTRGYPGSFLMRAGIVVSIPQALLRRTCREPLDRQLVADLEAAQLIRREFGKPDESAPYWLNMSHWREFFYDARAIFPLRNESGELIGFAGRALNSIPKADAPPKYLYTPGFKRSETLYRAEFAFSHIENIARTRRQKGAAKKNETHHLYIVEGLLDALRLEALGFPAVSILGARITDKQADAVSALVERLHQLGSTLQCHIFLDRDEAGFRGAAQVLRTLISRQIETDFIWGNTTTGKDPDELLRHEVTRNATTLLADWRQPPALALLADALGDSPQAVMSYAGWDDVSPSRFRRGVQSVISEFTRRLPIPDQQHAIAYIRDLLCQLRRETAKDGELSEAWWLKEFRALAVPTLQASVTTWCAVITLMKSRLLQQSTRLDCVFATTQLSTDLS